MVCCYPITHIYFDNSYSIRSHFIRSYRKGLLKVGVYTSDLKLTHRFYFPEDIIVYFSTEETAEGLEDYDLYRQLLSIAPFAIDDPECFKVFDSADENNVGLIGAPSTFDISTLPEGLYILDCDFFVKIK